MEERRSRGRANAQLAWFGAGRRRTECAPHGDPPVNWDEKTNIKWKVEIPGRGVSTPIVWGQQMFLSTAIDTGRVAEGATKPEDQPERPFGIKFPNTFYKYVVLCLDRATGKTLWERTAVEDLPHEGHHGDSSFASASPTTDGRRLYVSFGSRGVYCFDLSGELQWKRAIDTVQTRLSFGEACSPVLHGESLVLNRDNEGKSHLLVLDARSGEVRWKADRDEVERLGDAARDRAQRPHADHYQRQQACSELRPGDGRSDLGVRRSGQQRDSIPGPVRQSGVLHERL